MALSLIEQRSFALGEFPEASGEPGSDPTTIPDGGARLIENGLIGDDGILYRRGGAAYHSTANLNNQTNRFLWTGHLSPGDRTLFGTAGQSWGVLNDAKLPIELAIDGASSSGPRSPGTVVDDASVGDKAWSNPGNATISDDVRATSRTQTVTEVFTHYLKATNFGFSIPAGASIVGIVVEAEKLFIEGVSGDAAMDHRVRIVKGGAIGVADRGSVSGWPVGPEAYVTHGGASDIWGETWTAEEINASNFGVAIAAKFSAPGFGGEARIDHIRIIVHYVPSLGATTPASTGVLEGLLYIGNSFLAYGGSRKASSYSADTVTTTNGSKTVTGAATSWLANVDKGMLFRVSTSERPYIVASVDSDTQITLRDKYEGSTAGGKSYKLLNLLLLEASGAQGWRAKFFTVAANRLVALNTSGTGDVDGSTLVRVSEIGKPWSFLDVDRHRLPEGVEITGGATVGQTVLIFTTQGIWTLEGLAFDITDDAGNPQHRLQRYSHDLVLTSEPGIASLGDALVVPCTDGVFLIDGISAPLRLSRSIDPGYRTVTKLWSVGRAAVYRNHYFLPFTTADHTEIRKLWVCRLDRPSDSPIGVVYPWTEFSQDGASVSGYAVTPEADKLLGAGLGVDKRILDCSGYFTPGVGNKSDAGGTFGFKLHTRLFPTGNNTLNRVKQVRLSYELADAAADNPTITAERTSDLGSFVPLLLPSATAPENLDPEKPHKWRVNKRLRRVGYQFQCADPTSKLIIRKVETRIAPSEATRR